jgi:hypothetical protein
MIEMNNEKCAEVVAVKIADSQGLPSMMAAAV